MEVKLFRNAVTGTNSLHLDIEYFGQARLDKAWHGETPPLPINRLYLVEKGEAFLWINGRQITMRPGMAYLIPAGVTLGYNCPTCAEKLYFYFNLYRADGHDLLHCCANILSLPIAPEVIAQLRSCGDRAQWNDILTLKRSLYQLLEQFQEEYQLFPQEVPAYSETVLDTIRYIRENLSAKLQLDTLARRRYISRSTLADLFRKEVGISLGRYIDDQLLAAAQLRLSLTEEPISHISQQLGYSDQSYFSRRFKELCGMTPLEYRNKSKLP